MKKHILLLAAAIFALTACDEVPPKVTGSMGGGVIESPVEDQLRQVIIEEFTGVRCVNCPAGSSAIQDLLAIHGERLVAVSMRFWWAPVLYVCVVPLLLVGLTGAWL